MNQPRTSRLFFVVNAPQSFLGSRSQVARAAKKRGMDVGVAAPKGPAFSDLNRTGIHALAYPLNRGGIQPWKELLSVSSLRRIFRAYRPDVIHTVGWKPIIYGGIAARHAGVPGVVHTIAGLGYAFSSNKLKPRMIRTVLRLALRYVCKHPNTRIIVQNPDDERLVTEKLGVPEEQVTLILSSGVDLHENPVLTEAAGIPLVVLPGRLLWSKGVPEYVGAARILKGQGINCRLALVGDTDSGNPEGIPKETLQGWHEERVVEWWGWQDEMPKVYEQAHIVCLPSKYREGVPRVLMEAAASGRPIITTNAPGCRETCKDGETGFLVPPGDVKELADALRKLIENPALARRMGLAGRQYMEERFSQERVVKETLKVYDELLANVNLSDGRNEASGDAQQ